jgi:two-component system response regulator YesN
LRLKIDKAKELLLDEQYSIKQVAALVGIHNPLYFSRLFRKLTGQSPRQFREDGFG